MFHGNDLPVEPFPVPPASARTGRQPVATLAPVQRRAVIFHSSRRGAPVHSPRMVDAFALDETALDELHHLVATTPFDTVATVLRHRATARPEDAAHLLAVAAWCSVIRDQLDEAAQLAAMSQSAMTQPAIADRGPDRRLATIVDSLVMMIDALRGQRSVDHQLLDELASVMRSDDDRELHTMLTVLEPILEIANWFTFVDRYDDAAWIVDRRIESLEDSDTSGLVSSLCCLAELDWQRGRWSGASRGLVTALATAEAAGHEAGYAHVLAARVFGARGEWDECTTGLAAARASSVRRGDTTTMWRADAVEGFVALCRSDYDTAVSVLTPLVARNEQVGAHLASVRLWDGDLIEAMVRSGHRDDARVEIKRLRVESEMVPSRWLSGIIARCEAMVALDANEAVQLAAEAVAHFEAIGAVFEQGRSELVRAEAHANAGDAAGASHAARRASQIFAAIGAAPWSAKTETSRVVILPEPRPAPCHDLTDVLTSVEREVVSVLLRGETNQQIAREMCISIKTVESHLTRSYRKLGFSSRAELMAALLSH